MGRQGVLVTHFPPHLWLSPNYLLLPFTEGLGNDAPGEDREKGRRDRAGLPAGAGEASQCHTVMENNEEKP